MAKPELDENLDDVISKLIDDGESGSSDPAGSTAFEGIDTSQTTTDGPVIQLTGRAARQVSRIKSSEDLDVDLYLRVAVEGGGCSGLSYKLGFDYKTGDDELYESNGIEIVVDSKHLMYLRGITIDYPDGLDARGFIFNNPNASESCGCGSSFAV